MFNLDQAIATWRRQMAAGGVNSPEVLDELESHLRDDLERQMQSGSSEEQAFQAAVHQIGQAGVLKKEFKRAGGLKGAFPRKLRGILARLSGVQAAIPLPPLSDLN